MKNKLTNILPASPKIVDKTWNVIKNGIQSLLNLFQKRELPAIEPAELPPDEPIISAPFVLGESKSALRNFAEQYTIHG